MTIDTYSDNSTSSERAKIIAIDSDSVDIVYVMPTIFNILQNTTLDIQQVLDQDSQLSESDKILVMTESAVIVCLSSNFYMNNIDLFSEYDDETDYIYYFRLINPMYKSIKISNSYINVSGMILYADEQVEATLENLIFDLYRTQAGVFFDMTCKDPSLVFNSTFNVINVELLYSQDRIDVSYKSNPIQYVGSGDINYYNFTSNVFIEIDANITLVLTLIDGRWLMESESVPIFNISNTYISIPQQENINMENVYSPFLVQYYTDDSGIGNQVQIHWTNITFDNMQIYALTTFGFETGLYSDIFIEDLTYKNIYLTKEALFFYEGKTAYIENLNINNWTFNETELIYSNTNYFTIK